MKNRLKYGVSFGVGIAVFLVLRCFYLNDTNESIIKVIVSALLAGVVSGLIVGWLMGKQKKT